MAGGFGRPLNKQNPMFFLFYNDLHGSTFPFEALGGEAHSGPFLREILI